MNNYNHVLVDAKAEYTKQLVDILAPAIVEGIQSIFEHTKTHNNNLYKFQENLAKIPSWEKDRIQKEYFRIIKITKCEWIDSLITAVFVSHTKVLTSIKITKTNNKVIDLKVPTADHFIHLCYIGAARKIWKRTYLYTNFNKIDSQKNMIAIEDVVAKSIEETIRKQLPVKNILREYLGDEYVDDIIDDDISINSLTSMDKHNLKRLVKKELEMSILPGDDTYSNYKIDCSSVFNDPIDLHTPKGSDSNLTNIINDTTTRDIPPNPINNREYTITGNGKVDSVATELGGVTDKVQSIIEDKVQSVIEDKVQSVIEDKVESVIEDKVESIIEDKVESIIEDKVESIIEDKVESIIEDKVQSIIEDKVQSVIEDKVESIIEDKVESIIEDKVESLIEDKVQSIIEDKVESVTDKIESIIEDKVESVIEDKVESIIEDKVESIIEDKVESIGDKVESVATEVGDVIDKLDSVGPDQLLKILEDIQSKISSLTILTNQNELQKNTKSNSIITTELDSINETGDYNELDSIGESVVVLFDDAPKMI